VALFRRQSGTPDSGFAVPFGPQTPPFDPYTAVLPPTAGPPVPVRLRVPSPTGKAGDWLPGTLRINPGSLIWVPEPGVPAVPVDLTRAVIVNVMNTGKRGGAFANVEIDTPAGRVQLEQDPDMFAMTLEMIAQ
jgi:hypothetical protein